MRWADVLAYTISGLSRHKGRSFLMVLAMAIGISAVIVLTAVGEGARRFVVGEFVSLGTNMVFVVPGRSETAGFTPAIFGGEMPRDLTIRDAMALGRHPAVLRVAPVNVGEASISWQGRSREVSIIGTTRELLAIRHWRLSKGNLLQEGDPEQATPVCIIGAKIRREIFRGASCLGKVVRIGDRRARVIGVLAPEGRSIGIDVEELVLVPVAFAQQLFNTGSLFRIVVEVRDPGAISRVKTFIEDTIRGRHQGELDVTVVTQDAVIATFDKIMKALTLGVGGVAGISLGVAGILIMNVMLLAVSQRTHEIGLLKALGADRIKIITLVLAESGFLALVGTLTGLVTGWIGLWMIWKIFPALPAAAPWWAVAGSLFTGVATGLLFGWLPARRAARLDPVLALTRR